MCHFPVRIKGCQSAGWVVGLDGTGRLSCRHEVRHQSSLKDSRRSVYVGLDFCTSIPCGLLQIFKGERKGTNTLFVVIYVDMDVF